MPNQLSVNPLDRLVRKLAKDYPKAEHAIIRLKRAIEHQRKQGGFDEAKIVEELEHIKSRAEIAVEAIDHLAVKLMESAP
jgi:hypothetical protein